MSKHDVIVIGGGPAGTTAAAAAALEGLDVLLLEAGEHPRTHVGESLLPGIIPILDRIGALPSIERAGFERKTGSTLWNWGRTPRWDLWFADSDAYDHAWFVERSIFDTILFENAARVGAHARMRSPVRELLWEGERLVGVRWSAERGAALREARARFVVDASGASALVARHRELGRPLAGLQHQAMWAHFEGVERLPDPRRHQALFVAEPDQWWWCFPLAGGKTSIGVVQIDAGPQHRTAPRRDFDGELAKSRSLVEALGPRARRTTAVRHARDWSYRSSRTAGPGWFSIGDAAAFIDPVLSTGVMLAMHSGWHAASSIAEISRGADESAVQASYSAHHQEMFDDLLGMVRFYYRQNLHCTDYFWESKRILEEHDVKVRPQKAFVVLTSGLVQNLPLADKEREVDARRRQRVDEEGRDAVGSAEVPQRLEFVCIHLRDRTLPTTEASLYVLLEPTDPVAPTLFRTRNFHFNAIAPRHGNDPISVPCFAPVLRALHQAIADLDDVDGESLAGFWARRRTDVARVLDRIDQRFEVVRVFGE